MASTTFQNNVTVSEAAWFQDINDYTYLSAPKWCGTAGGTADAITISAVSTNLAITAYLAGQSYMYKSSASVNTGAMTVAVDGLATKAIQKNGAAMVAGDHPADKWFRITYDGAAFQIEQIFNPLINGLVPVANGGTNLASGTSGGVLGYTATGTLASSAALAANAIVIGGGAGATPTTTTTGTGVLTALGVNVGTAGAFITNGGDAGTPSALVGTNISGTAASLTAGTASAVAVGGITGLGTGVATALAVNVGSAGAPVVLNGAGGTPSSITLTNGTGLPVAGITASTSTALGVGSIELGHASDTTITRVSAGKIAVEGVTVADLGANIFTGQQTFKETADTVYTITDGAAFEIDPVNGNIQVVTLGASRTPAATNFAAGQAVLLGVDDGTAYTITWTTVNPTWVVPGGTASAPTLATTGYTWVMLWKVGTTIYGCEVGKP